MIELETIAVSWVHPAAIFILGALLVPVLKGKLKQLYMLLLPLAAFTSLLLMHHGTYWNYTFMGYNLIFGRVDNLSLCFGYIFVIMSFLGIIYANHVREDGQHIAALLYAGSSLGVVFAGDLFSLLVFWEIMAFSSVFLIVYQKEKASIAAGLRYLVVHAFGGSCLLAGIIIYFTSTGSILFETMNSTSAGSLLILVGFLLNAAVPPLHAWLSDAYPEGTITGSVFLSAFTTKTAVYALIRGFPGWDILIGLGTIMAIYGIVFAILENDIRRILAYSIINQVGFMVVGIGIGTELALNGSSAHAFSHILYKGLLWMSAGAVLYMTGKRKCTELGGLYKSMPLTLIFCLVGAASISAFPLFSGFTTKSMIISAAADRNMPIVFLLLQLASAGVFLHAGIKFPYFVFFAKDSGIRTRDPPWNMLLAMAIASLLCILLGIYPQILYNILPSQLGYNAYTPEHVVGQMQLLMSSALAFFVMLPLLKRTKTITLDTDWFYRKSAGLFLLFCKEPMMRFAVIVDNMTLRVAHTIMWFANNPTGTLKVMKSYIPLIRLRRFIQPGLKKSEHSVEATIRLEEQRVVHLGKDEQMGLGFAILLIIIILLLYLIIYVVRI